MPKMSEERSFPEAERFSVIENSVTSSEHTTLVCSRTEWRARTRVS
jgi:hypothetical protein